jgi:hypothetical protein
MLRESLCVLAGLCFASTVHAADLESAWHSPTGCPSALEADRRLRERTQGFSALSSGQAQVWIDHAPSGELRARITLVQEDGREQRVLYGRDCDALSDAVLLVISMGLEAEAEAPSRAREQTVPNLPEPKHEQPAAVADPLNAPESEAAASTNLSASSEASDAVGPSNTSTRLGPAFTVDRGSLSDTSFAGSGVIALGRGRLQGSLAISYFSRQQVSIAKEKGASAEFGLITGELRGCYLGLGDSLDVRVKGRKGYSLGPCVGLELGSQRGQGVGLVQASRRAGAWVAGQFGLGLSLGPYGRLVPTGALALGVAIKRPRFEVGEAGTVFQANQVFLRATLGLLIELNP